MEKRKKTTATTIEAETNKALFINLGNLDSTHKPLPSTKKNDKGLEISLCPKPRKSTEGKVDRAAVAHKMLNVVVIFLN